MSPETDFMSVVAFWADSFVVTFCLASSTADGF